MTLVAAAFFGVLVVVLGSLVLMTLLTKRLVLRPVVEDCTGLVLTTAYFAIGDGKARGDGTSRHEDYTRRIRQVMRLPVHIQIFCDAKTEPVFREARGDSPFKTRIQTMTFETLVDMVREKSHFDGDLLRAIDYRGLAEDEKDYLVHAPSPELLFMWIAKSFLVQETLRLWGNHRYFGWIDAGHKHFVEAERGKWDFVDFPCRDMSKIPSGKVVVQRLPDACHPRYFSPAQSRCPAGNLWFGEREPVEKLCEGLASEIGARLRREEKFGVVVDQDLLSLVGDTLGLLWSLPEDTNPYSLHAFSRCCGED